MFRSVIALSSFWCYWRNTHEILMQSRLLVLEVAYFCYLKCVWLASGATVPSFWREVGNPRGQFIAVIFFFISLHNYSFKLVHSSTHSLDSLVLILHGRVVIKIQCHRMIILILSSLVVTQMWMSNVLFVLFLALTFEWYHMSERCFIGFLMEETTVMLNLGVPWHTVFFFIQPPLCQPKTKVSFPHSSFASKIYAAWLQDSGCILLREGNYFLSPGWLWQKPRSNPEH